MKEKPKPADPEQYKRFLEAAKEAGADETEAGAARAFKRVTRKESDLTKDTSANPFPSRSR